MPLRGPRVTHCGRYANVPQRPRILTRGGREPGMATITLHYSPECAACARQAQLTASLDWLGRVALSTASSPIGPVPKGRIVVVDTRDRRVFTGIFATRKICLQVPLFFLYGLLLTLPPVRWLALKDDPGRNGDACEI